MFPYAAGVCEVAFDTENIENAENAENEVTDVEGSIMPSERRETFGINGV